MHPRVINCNFEKGPTFAKLWNLFSSSPRLETYGATVLELRHDYYETLLELRRVEQSSIKNVPFWNKASLQRFARIIIIIIHKHFKLHGSLNCTRRFHGRTTHEKWRRCHKKSALNLSLSNAFSDDMSSFCNEAANSTLYCFSRLGVSEHENHSAAAAATRYEMDCL